MTTPTHNPHTLVEQHRVYARWWAGRYRGRGIPWTELQQHSLVGLWEALPTGWERHRDAFP